jgi:hypothetical protein
MVLALQCGPKQCESQRRPDPDKTQHRKGEGDTGNIHREPDRLAVPGLANHARRAYGEPRKLLAEQHEDDAVGSELDQVPYGTATNPGDGKRLTAPFYAQYRGSRQQN